MKKILFLFVSALTLGLTSCSKDDGDSASIVGSWEYYQEGFNYSGQEELGLHSHDCTSNKDYLVFNEDGTMTEYFYDMDCDVYAGSGTWSKDGKNLTVTLYGETETAKIEKLSSSILKVSITYNEGGESYQFIQVFQRK
ncbi:lipocalin-like domain-containing protein [Flavobacterium haoranii]|uniref:Lipocalin-like domain-containing protein n=1 Tax=Flavobacterium haoranii TaxID=683124 RepID=A0A1M6KZC3_9FLAO|nr:lipocalin family protein [Flavobacterium haoranii]SHJ64279.1 Lipocalin-like domain-containing protein [Flavobacterium haoranii]